MKKLLTLLLAATLGSACSATPEPLVAIQESAPHVLPSAVALGGRPSFEDVLFVTKAQTDVDSSAGFTLDVPRLCSDARTSAGFYGFYRTDAWDSKRVALTFDDGPHEKLTPGVLAQLEAHGQTATFFLVGRNINRTTYPLVQRMVRTGHTLGSHSYTHNVQMTRVDAPEASVAEIVGQHAVTAMLIDLALVASSADDFDHMFAEVFERDPAVWLTGTIIRTEWRAYAERHTTLLHRLGYEGAQRPYHVVYSRPPGGGPYVEQNGARGITIYDRAMAELGMVNVLWNSASGDTVPEKRKDFAFLTDNIAKGVKAGGVLLIHDYMRPDALAHSLAAIASDTTVRVVSLGDGIERKYACSERELLAFLRPGA